MQDLVEHGRVKELAMRLVIHRLELVTAVLIYYAEHRGHHVSQNLH